MTNESSTLIDLRCDTVTRPSASMHVSMAATDVGDDPSVNRLQARAAGFSATSRSITAGSCGRCGSIV
jgi:threonine aldolase